MPAWALAAVAGVGIAHVAARYAGARLLAGVLKPLPILLLALLVAGAAGRADGRYAALVAGALLCSMAGDVLLVFPTRFVAGLTSFFVAHLFYLAAFAPAGGSGPAAWLAALPFAGLAGGFLRILWPRLGRVRWAVVAYVVTIAAMGWRAALRAPVVAAPGGGLALAGALLFMTSDTTLATQRFVRPFRAADALVMTTYYAAQTLLAWSAL